MSVTSNNAYPETRDSTLINKREFNAPRDRVFRAWTDAADLSQWWKCPEGMQFNITGPDVRPGGEFRYDLTLPDGNTIRGKFVYTDVNAPEQLVYLSSFTDGKGTTIAAPFAPKWPLEVKNTLLFEEKDGKTTITSWSTPHNASEAEHEAYKQGHQFMKDAFNGTLNFLDELLER